MILSSRLAELRRASRFGDTRALTLADPEGDGVDDLFLGTRGFLTRIELPSRVVHRFRLDNEGETVSGVAVDDIDGDGTCDVALVTEEGSVEVFGLDGWVPMRSVQGLTGTYGMSLTQAAGTLAIPEVVVGRRPAGLLALEGAHLSRIMTYDDPPFWAHVIETGDVHPSSGREWVIGTGGGITDRVEDLTGHLFALREDGTVVWRTDDPEGSLAGKDGSLFGLAILDLDFDATNDIVVSNDQSLVDDRLDRARVRRILGAGPSEAGEVVLDGHDAVSLAHGDVTGDGVPDVVGGDRRGYLRVFANTESAGFAEIFRSGDLGTSPVGLEVADLDGARPDEIIVGTEDGTLRVLRLIGGSLEELARVDHLGSHLYGVAVGDLLGDRNREIAVGNARGDLFVYDRFLQPVATAHGLGAFPGAYDSLEIADVDGDFVPELVVGGSGYVHVFELRNELTIPRPGNPPGGGRPTGYDHAPPPPGN